MEFWLKAFPAQLRSIQLQRLASYSPLAFAHTKRIIARNMIEELTSCLPAARQMHKKLLATDQA